MAKKNKNNLFSKLKSKISTKSEDEEVEDQLIEDQLVEDQLVEDQLVEDQLIEDQLVEEPLNKIDDLEYINEDLDDYKPRPSAKEKKINKLKYALQSIIKKISSKLYPKEKSKSIDFVELLFSIKNRKKAHQVFVVSMAIVSMYSLGKISALLTKSATEKIKSKQNNLALDTYKNKKINLSVLNSANLFNAKKNHKTQKKKQTKSTKIDRSKICLRAKKKSNLSINLENLTVLQNNSKSIIAVTVNRKDEIQYFREGETIPNLATISKIINDRVILKNLSSGECEYIQAVDKSKSKSKSFDNYQIVKGEEAKHLLSKDRPTGITNDGNSFIIKKSFRDELLSDIGSVLTQARAIQKNNPDGSMSFLITEIVPGSIYSHLNIKNDDIINSFNGKQFTNLNEIMNLFGKIKEMDTISIAIERNGTNMDLEYSFE